MSGELGSLWFDRVEIVLHHYFNLGYENTESVGRSEYDFFT